MSTSRHAWPDSPPFTPCHLGALLGVGSLLMLGGNAHFLQQAHLAGAGAAGGAAVGAGPAGPERGAAGPGHAARGPLVLAGLLLAGSLTGYYMSQFGVVMDPDMIRNVLKTHWTEARELMTWSLVMHVGWWGLMPALLVSRFTAQPSGHAWWRDLLSRLGWMGQGWRCASWRCWCSSRAWPR